MTHPCVSCGTSIPDKQRVCSVCYGDPFYGTDGILLRMMQEAEREEWARLEAEREEANRQLAEEQEDDAGVD